MAGHIEEYLGILVDYSRDNYLSEQGKAMLTKSGFYKREFETSPQQGFARAATCFCFGDYGLAQRIYDASSKHWFTYASPVLSNAVEVEWPDFDNSQFLEAGDWLEENVEPDGQPISCFLLKIPDNKEGIVKASSEARWLSMLGGGLGIQPMLRTMDEKSTGVMSHLKGYDADTLSYKQKESRRGSIAAYLDIDHPEIMQFTEMRDPTGGDLNQKCFNLNNAVNIPDWFMHKVILGEEYELIDPKHGATGRKLKAREVWGRILDMRFETGEPYIHWVDTTNKNLPSWITKATYNVTQSNLCSEITLMTSAKRTAVCCLSSLNIEKYEEWKDSTIVEDLTRFLDNVLEYFIRLAPPELSRAIHSASMERALGMGQLGWHSFFQKHRIPFESGGFNSASQWSHVISKTIQDRAIEESKTMAKERGEAPDCVGSGMRNSHLISLAPNASSSSMINVSPSAEPWAANAFTPQGRSGSFLLKNKYLEKELDELGINTKEVWKDILENKGSIQHRTDIPEDVKKLFLTFEETDPRWIIELAAIRQANICQSQSVNMKVPKTITRQEMSDIHMLAWAKGLKTLYYCRSEKPKNASTKTSSEEIRQPLNRVEVDFSEPDCKGCDG